MRAVYGGLQIRWIIRESVWRRRRRWIRIQIQEWSGNKVRFENHKKELKDTALRTLFWKLCKEVHVVQYFWTTSCLSLARRPTGDERRPLNGIELLRHQSARLHNRCMKPVQSLFFFPCFVFSLVFRRPRYSLASIRLRFPRSLICSTVVNCLNPRVSVVRIVWPSRWG